MTTTITPRTIRRIFSQEGMSGPSGFAAGFYMKVHPDDQLIDA
jgi:hypothetical protein